MTQAQTKLVRIVTAGSVDDGKSTLIGRILHDSKALMSDQVDALSNARYSRAEEGDLDLSFVTDGLESEREQGITIDVAYRYFATPQTSFIVIDAPGHEQYTRNMVTGA
ncbi:MAG: GTP-binding protein, partial [Hyphomonadaceae bacterium]